jgi:hypothetical protein
MRRILSTASALLLFILCLLPPCASAQGQTALPPAASQKVDFARDIAPLLQSRCFRCHQGTGSSSGYRLDLRAEIIGDTNGKPLAVPGKSGDSRLIHVVSSAKMPKNGKPLSPAEIGLLRAWIDQGLAWDQALFPTTLATDHWAFRPVAKPPVPVVKNQQWVRNPIDAFVAAKHEVMGFAPAAEASRPVLIRRLYLDLIGLLPTPEEVDNFVKDRSPDAYEKLVDRLLASPHYGERWGRHWLDVARWAESEGYESNHLRPFAWRYRDYVVQSLNQDKPFDQFVREQIAGDEITPYSDTNLIATGFLAAARLSSNEEDKWLQRNDVMIDIVNATASTFLGLTMNCAQCHNHKFDPITARDYYRFQGFFLKGQPANLEIRDPQLWSAFQAKRPPDYEDMVREKWDLYEVGRKSLIDEVRKTLNKEQLAALAIPCDKRTNEEEKIVRATDHEFQFSTGKIESGIPAKQRKRYDELKKKLADLDKTVPAHPQTFGFYSPITSPTKIAVLPMKGFYPLPYEPEEMAIARPYLQIGGDVHDIGPKVDVGWPALFGPTPKSAVEKHPRLALADWLVSKTNPLTARVHVNRLWQHHFGRGIVTTPGDFGTRGAPPTHPELLDWLARELMDQGWSNKHIHRLIVTSSTYRQSSRHQPEYAEKDEDNQYLWHWQPRRLEAEIIRDLMLAVSGQLDAVMGGPSDAVDGDSLRRGLYLFQKRDFPNPVAALFDGPSACLESASYRHVSTVPLQALYLLNNKFVLDRAKAFAERVEKQAGTDRDRQIQEVFRLALGRLPDDREAKLSQRFFETYTGNRESALTHFCQALMNTNEFLYIE